MVREVNMDIDYSKVVGRMKEAGSLKNDSALARKLGVTPQALSNYKKRGRLPAGLIIKFASLYAVSVDWVLTGKGAVYREGGGSASTLFGFVETVGVGSGAAGVGEVKVTGISELSPEEMVCVGNLMKVLRSGNVAASEAARAMVDAIASYSEKDETGGAHRLADGEVP